VDEMEDFVFKKPLCRIKANVFATKSIIISQLVVRWCHLWCVEDYEMFLEEGFCNAGIIGP